MIRIIATFFMILVANSAYGKVALKLKFDVDYTSSTKADDTQEDESSSLNYGAYAGGGWLADSGLYLGLTAYLQTWNNSNSTTTAGVTTSTDGSNDFSLRELKSDTSILQA